MHPRNRDEYGTAENMTTDEKTISFLNMYFVFKKMRSLTVQQLNRIYNYNSDVLEEPMVEQGNETVEKPKHIVRKLKRPKITIATTEPIVMPMIEKKQEKKDEDKTAKKEEEKPKEENVVEEPEEEVPEEKAEEKPKEEEEEVVNAEEEIIIVKPKKIKKTSKK